MKSAAAGVIAMVVIAVALAVAWQQHPDDRVLLWSDEFNGSAGALPDRANWSEEEGYERNDELQTYTVGDPRTASMDGLGSLRITVHLDPQVLTIPQPTARSSNETRMARTSRCADYVTSVHGVIRRFGRCWHCTSSQNHGGDERHDHLRDFDRHG